MARSTSPDAPLARFAPTDRLWRLPGVYAPQHDTRLLAAALRHEGSLSGLDVLDIGTGSGALALYAAHLGARVTALDVSRRAAWSTRFNAWRAGLPVDVHRGRIEDLAGRRFDLILSNPPYVPAPHRRPPTRGAARAWDAGVDGRHVLDQLGRAAPALLGPHGVFLLVHSALSGADATLDMLEAAGLRAKVADRELIPYGPVLRSRLGWLRARGLVGPDETMEELVVIRAEHI
ncbi:HemK2/MTQ2 family protein methyltransferase [Streptomyces xanthochromogenes]|uniref:HemK2/MTQ2 family protein methyltransferase n=1 Tax=Streptomyces xanthochromogenes TaxID=67384 RepID=UPI00382486EC